VLGSPSTNSRDQAMYYMHAVNPHAGAEFADAYFEGRKFVITETQKHPISIVQCFASFENETDAQMTVDDNVGKLQWGNRDTSAQGVK